MLKGQCLNAIEKIKGGTWLVVQWLKPHTPSAGAWV